MDKAVADYAEAIRLDPKSALAYYNRGIAYAKKSELTRRSPTIPRPLGSTQRWAWRTPTARRLRQKGEKAKAEDDSPRPRSWGSRE